MFHVLLVVHDVLLCFTMFSESRNYRHPRIGDPAAADCLRDRQQLCRDRRYRHESDPMLNSILNGDWSNSVPGRQFPKRFEQW